MSKVIDSELDKLSEILDLMDDVEIKMGKESPIYKFLEKSYEEQQGKLALICKQEKDNKKVADKLLVIASCITKIANIIKENYEN